MALALVAAAAVTAVVLPADAAETPVFTSGDVGFSEGGSLDGLAGRLDAMDAYVGDRKPMLRLDLNWSAVQPAATDEPRFTALDPVVDAAAARGIRVLLILNYGTTWTGGVHSFPSSDAAWRGIVDATVTHFGSKVQAYEVWNEPNYARFGDYGDGSAGVRRARYWQLVRIAHDRVHAGCAGCVVLAGASGVGDAVSETRNDNESAQWLDWAYANGYKNSFDAVAHHPYPAWNMGRSPSRPECTTRWWSMFGPPDAKCAELAAVRAVMVARGDSAKKIWGTEFGYPSTGTGITKLTPAAVRDNLEESVRMWRALDYTGPLFLYSFRDAAVCGPDPADAECHFGLVDTAGKPKQPAYDSLQLALTDTRLRTLAPGRSLHRASALRSTDGRLELWLRADGNLILYLGKTELWKKVGLQGVRLTNQTDGNLVLFDGAGKRVWSTGAEGRGVSDLDLQDDGNLVLYPRDKSKKLWSTNTYGH
ncbi:hypothetical protein AFR_05265 [Actinoplanes friuliensis DSM 7358]|uniref:Bulb-type lectin domain-containing protein n=2 Tax=Actinoplanes friuliensis TaxID=196914 RepID=U5VRA4_9ACTN|nr:hypothetical protein AFR_05265 [Actinoplanes friuliensis DSM 7358]